MIHDIKGAPSRPYKLPDLKDIVVKEQTFPVNECDECDVLFQCYNKKAPCLRIHGPINGAAMLAERHKP